MEKIKIGFYQNNINLGGVAHYILLLIENLPAEKFDVVVYLKDPKNGESENYLAELKKRKARVEYIDEDGRLESIKKAPSLPSAGGSAQISGKPLFKRFQQMLPEVVKKFLYRSALLLRTKKFFDREQFDVFHINVGWFPQNQLASAAAVLSGAKVKVLTVHNADAAGQKKIFTGLGFIRQFRHVIAVSSVVRRELVEHFGFEASRVQLIYNGVRAETKETAKADARREKYGIGEGERFILFPARVDPLKGHDVLLKALTLLDRAKTAFKIFLAGEGREEERLKQRASKLGLDSHVIFGGYQKNIGELFRLCDFVILPSLTEGFPFVLLEAFAARKPVIATCVGDVPKLVGEDGAGILIPPADPRALAEELGRLLAMNPEKLREMGEKGYERVNRLFSFRQMLEKTYACYEEFNPFEVS